jgi:hypothetical protein
MSSAVRINFASEGMIDAAVARRLICHVGAEPGLERPAHGKHKLDPNISRYRRAATHGHPWLILRDLDRDAACASELMERLGIENTFDFCFRIAVREIESWLIADRYNLSQLLRIPVGKIESDPENLSNPKRHIIDLARSSRSRSIRDALVPDERAGQEQGPEYAALITHFARSDWDIAAAINSGASRSLTKAATRLGELVARQTQP